MKIDDPKTPYHEDNSEGEQENETSIQNADPEDPIVQAHLREAKVNRDKNA
jgi:hypothetical protein